MLCGGWLGSWFVGFELAVWWLTWVAGGCGGIWLFWSFVDGAITCALCLCYFGLLPDLGFGFCVLIGKF